eukprot:TRINITY_DN66588_c12_g3_i1.p1 TRINITY_DN66588_c12_g3~~TRINITY_DN66588_c12_g3_i1.p1  ORF type:complete len:737 (-),score=391.48 TRINITY_DN66588_c12_g3_i1:55-2265(-)
MAEAQYSRAVGYLLDEHEAFHRAFANHLQQEYSEENILFWRAVRQYQAIPDLIDATNPRHVRVATDIVNLFIRTGSRHQINVRGPVQLHIIERLSLGDASADLFDDAMAEILNLMTTDSFRRFCKTDTFKQLGLPPMDVLEKRATSESYKPSQSSVLAKTTIPSVISSSSSSSAGGGSASGGVGVSGGGSGRKLVRGASALFSTRQLRRLSDSKSSHEDDSDDDDDVVSKCLEDNLMLGNMLDDQRSPPGTTLHQIAEELFRSEREYITGLKMLVRSRLWLVKAAEMKATPMLLSPTEIDAIFSNLPDIFELNRKVHSEIRVAYFNGALLRELPTIFRPYTPFFKLYTVYVNSVGESRRVLAETIAKRPAFAQHIRILEAVECVSDTSPDLSSFLIAPVQRVPQYVRLFELTVKYAKRYAEWEAKQKKLDEKLAAAQSSSSSLNAPAGHRSGNSLVFSKCTCGKLLSHPASASKIQCPDCQNIIDCNSSIESSFFAPDTGTDEYKRLRAVSTTALPYAERVVSSRHTTERFADDRVEQKLDDIDIPALEACLAEISKVSEDIQFTVNHWAARARVVQIASKFPSDCPLQLVNQNRYHVRDGPLNKMYNSGVHLSAHKEYHFFLFNDVLVYAVAPSQFKSGGKFDYKHTLPLLGMAVEDVPDTPESKIKFAFKLTPRMGKTITVGASNAEEKFSWISDIMQCVRIAALNKRTLNSVNNTRRPVTSPIPETNENDSSD